MLADTVIRIQLAGVSEEIERAADMLRLDAPTGSGLAAAPTCRQFRADFGVNADARPDIDAAKCRAPRIALVADDAGSDTKALVVAFPTCANACVQFAIAKLVDFVIGDNELRIQIEIAAQHWLFERDGAGKQVDIVVEKARQLAAPDDDFRAEAVAGFERDRFAIGDDPPIAERVRARDPLALDFVTPEARADFGGEPFGANAAEFCLALHAGRDAVIASEARLVEAGLEISVEGIEGRAFDADIEFLARGGIEPAARCIGEDGIIGIGIDGAEDALILVPLGTVV